MLDYSRVERYYIACGYTDMRKQIDGLVAVVELQFKQKLDETSIFLFCGRRADRIKALYWDGTGYVLLYKRLAEEAIPMAAECAGSEAADKAGVPVAHGGAVHRAEEGV